MVTQFGNAYVCGAMPRCKRSTRNVQTRTHRLIQYGIPPLSSVVTPFWPSDLPFTSSPRPSEHTPVWHPVQSVYNGVTPIKHTLKEYTFLSQEGIHIKALFHSLFSPTLKSIDSEIRKWKRWFETSLQRRIIRPSKIETFHKEHTLVIQFIVCNNLHYSMEYFIITREYQQWSCMGCRDNHQKHCQ